jgi:glycosyltransferase involved in cell wall biosynthesis
VEHLGDEFRFRVITRDRDLGDGSAYPDVNLDSWQSVGKAKVRYLVPTDLLLGTLRKLIAATPWDALYLNSAFSPIFTVQTLLLRRLGLLPDRPVIIAPRGEFSAGALALKSAKKQAYLRSANALGLYRGVLWQACSLYEEQDIRRRFGGGALIHIASNLPSLAKTLEASGRQKARGRLKIVFLSRVDRMKNLHGALGMLSGLKGEIAFHIYGAVSDPDYLKECQAISKSLSDNVEVRFHGEVPHEQVASVLRAHDLLLLPTLGENFGHVIFEALQAGCPVLISDRTPWRGLRQRGVGWDLPLEQPASFQAALQDFLEIDADTHRAWSARAAEFALSYSRDNAAIEQHKRLFRWQSSG